VELAVRQELAVVQVQVVLRAFLYHLHQVRGVPLSLLKVNMLQVQQRHIQ
jgi:Na+-translocating ferredoxin:NAD+ oxidoreductase RnfE subunit